ncbi:Zn-dependent protease with chaperone function [Catalinimonas alkaloidigena]|uniref:Zn-dependent protease with chaperone function n=1 Tax=Catalinimonas alkaloidigena TaxID=1075417 RepID=A0A1G9BP48_9BACT|nr:M48 family metallopeptidase [Catalinimonas alkaloidigena]SDK40645.1 Zn-dependent protease with chaperone function [Catalinimonas alkaloidigena]
MAKFYPHSPEIYRYPFTKTTRSYKKKVVYVLAGIFLFFSFYAGLIVGASYLLFLAIKYDNRLESHWSLLLKVGWGFVACMVLLFLLKFMFRQSRSQSPLHLELQPDEHPQLFAFLNQLCQETQAPFPQKVFVSHEANAMVFYEHSLLSLIWPVHKNLLIGLGLVNCVNLSEFKAVLAHEFGHFAQTGIRIGNYVHVANRIIHSMVYERDRWDNTLAQWRKSETVLAIPAWIIYPVTGTIRLMLRIGYQLLNLLYASLSREMEFHADRVAVSVTGSQAVVQALARLDEASKSLDFTWHHLAHATDHQLFTNNLFYHQRRALKHLRAQEGTEGFWETEWLHSPRSTKREIWYDSHPPDHIRAQHAQRYFVDAEEDTRSAWLLFSNPAQLQHRVSEHLYREVYGKNDIVFTDPTMVQAFIDREVAESTFDESYFGTYDQRMLHEFDLEEASAVLPFHALDKSPYNEALRVRMDAFRQKHRDLKQILRVLQGKEHPRVVEVNHREYPVERAGDLYKTLTDQLEEDNHWLADFDRRVFQLHLLRIPEQRADLREELKERYTFHFCIQRLYDATIEIQQRFAQLLNHFAKHAGTLEAENSHFTFELSVCQEKFAELLKLTEHYRLPALENVEAGAPLRSYLLTEAVFPFVSGGDTSERISTLVRQMEEVIKKLERMHYKSLGKILMLQETIRQLRPTHILS